MDSFLYDNGLRLERVKYLERMLLVDIFRIFTTLYEAEHHLLNLTKFEIFPQQ